MKNVMQAMAEELVRRLCYCELVRKKWPSNGFPHYRWNSGIGGEHGLIEVIYSDCILAEFWPDCSTVWYPKSKGWHYILEDPNFEPEFLVYEMYAYLVAHYLLGSR